LPRVKDSLDQRATITVLVRLREEAKLTRKALSLRLGERPEFVSLVEKSSRILDVPELRPYALACGRDPLEAYALILRETALYTTQDQTSATKRLKSASRRKATKKKRG
jgi:hypothetical protein